MPIRRRQFITIILSAFHAIMLAGSTQAATNFVWTVYGGYFGAASGSWSASTNWNPSGPANGANNTADFSQAFFENPSTVTLDGSFTIGNLHFNDTKGAGHAWFVETGSSGPLTLSVTSGSPTITVDNQQAATINAVLAGSGGLQKSGSGTLTLGGNSPNTFTGDTIIADGTLILAKPSGPALGGNVVFTGSAVAGTIVSDLVQSNDNQLVESAVVSFRLDGAAYGAWELLGHNPTVAGIEDNKLGVIEISQTAAQCTNNSTLTLNVSGSGSYTFAGRLWEHFDRTIGGTITVIKNGTGTQYLLGRHIQHAGSTVVNNGRLVLGSNCWNFVSIVTNNATFELWANTIIKFDTAPAPCFAGTGTLVKTGPETVSFGALVGAAGAYIGMGTNGLIDIQAGTFLNVNGSGYWTNNKASLNIASGAFLQMDANSVWVDALTGAGTINEGANPFPQTLTVGVAGGSGVFTGLIQNTGATLKLVKTGTGTQSLRGANTYTGGTIVSNGTLLVDNLVGSGTGTGAVMVASGATLGGSGVIAGPVTVNGTLAPGTSPGTLTISNKLVMNNGAALQYDLGTSSDQTKVTGNVTLNGTLNITDAGGFSTGTYVLVTYTGILTNNGLVVGTTPNPSFTYTVDTGTSGQVKLNVIGPVVTDPYTLWQQRYFHCTTCPEAWGGADLLGKGLSNTNQFLIGLDPTNSASQFRIISAEWSGEDVTLTWQAGGGRTNVLQAAAGLADGGYTNDFHDIATVIIPDTGDVMTNYTDTGGATNVPARYYRIRLGP